MAGGTSVCLSTVGLTESLIFLCLLSLPNCCALSLWSNSQEFISNSPRPQLSADEKSDTGRVSRGARYQPVRQRAGVFEQVLRAKAEKRPCSLARWREGGRRLRGDRAGQAAEQVT